MKKLVKGALAMQEECMTSSEANVCQLYASTRNLLYRAGKKIEIIRHTAVNVSYAGTEFGHLVDLVHSFAGYVIEAIALCLYTQSALPCRQEN